MQTKTNSEMLKSIKQSNKEARENRSIKMGFASFKELLIHLEGEILSGRGDETFKERPKVGVKPTVSKPSSKISSKPEVKKISAEAITIHVVDVLDASGSMSGAKYDAAKRGINLGVESLKTDIADVNYTYTLCDFSDDIIFRHRTASLDSVNEFKGETRGSTSLYDAIGHSVALIGETMGKEDKVLINIYTDGQENSSRKYKAADIAKLIEDLSKEGWTFTFIGTDFDVKYAQRNLKFHDSNTLVHDNTGAGMEKAFMTNNVARTAYSAKVERGEETSKGFYKDIN